jgi:hypothetical protein
MMSTKMITVPANNCELRRKYGADVESLAPEDSENNIT